MIKIKDLLGLPSLDYHVNNGLSLYENVYRYSSDSFIQLFAEARDAYRDGKIQLNEEDLKLIETTDIGLYGVFEGIKVPLDLPMLEAEIDYEKEKTWKIQDKFPIEVTARKGWSGNYYTIEPKPMDISYDAFVDLGSGENVDYTSYDYTTGEAQWTSDSLEQIKQWEEDNQDKIKVIYPKSLNEDDRKHALLRVEPRNYEAMIDKLQDMNINHRRESDNVIKVYIDNIPDKVIYNLTHDVYVDKFVLKESLNENKAIITFKNDYEVKMNTGEGYDDDFEYFEAGEREQVYILDKNDKRTHVEFGDGTNAYIPTSLISIQDKSLEEAKYKGKDVPLNKPKRGGSKKFFVYTKNKKGNVVKVSFGGTTGLSVKIKEKGARASFAARHKCATKKDKTKPGYWACNVGRYWKSLGGAKNFSGYW